ncbi:hypothetical protein FFWV33_08150 [Flavobacterium faecale]|uniref:DUF4369 domain-containing protein n=1 Tax=Flavobacterium faecale TaxID=1355330 RepID=A0A2S1LCM7_9FLAO|nr:DUF4369 domain-containing protein [Flavobacterium faecale]AWG21502.1 hypothetical protein FFWV33_08150 [Flavobacterium faecale]
MKNIILTIAAVLALASCDKKETAGNLHINGDIKGLKKGTLYIQRFQDNKYVSLDTITMDGQSTFQADLTIDSPEMLYLKLDRGTTNSLDNTILFFAEPGTISIQTNLDNYLSDAKITGSKNQELYEEYKALASKMNDQHLELLETKFYATKFQQASRIDSINKKMEQNTKRKYLYTANFAVNHKDAAVTPYIVLTEIPDINMKYLDTIQSVMTPEVAKTLYGKQLNTMISEIKKQSK